VGDGHYLHSDAEGFVYLAAVLDWATRRVLSWRLSNTLTTDFCLEAVESPYNATARRRSSIPTKAVSSPVATSLSCCGTMDPAEYGWQGPLGR